MTTAISLVAGAEPNRARGLVAEITMPLQQQGL
jgi:hypothetical protein